MMINPAQRHWFTNNEGSPVGRGRCEMCSTMCYARHSLALYEWDNKIERWLPNGISRFGHHDCLTPLIINDTEVLRLDKTNWSAMPYVYMRELPLPPEEQSQ